MKSKSKQRQSAVKTHYDILGIARQATPEQIKEAYQRKLSFAKHQEDADQEAGIDRARLINDAYLVLSSPVKRQLYDENLILAESAAAEIVDEPAWPRFTITKSIVLVVALLLLARIGWRYRDSELLHGWFDTRQHAPMVIKFNNDAPAFDSSAADADNTRPKARASVGMRKCRKNATVLYTDDDCPAGSQEQSISNGTVTMIPGTHQAGLSKESTPTDTRKTVRDLYNESNDNDLKEKRMDQIINH